MKQLFTTFATLIALSAYSFAGPLDGVWINTDATTRSITKVEITGTQIVWWVKNYKQDTKIIKPWTLTLLGDSVDDSSPNKYGYVARDSVVANKVMMIKRVGEQLIIESLTVFKDDPKRANYQLTLTFKKQP